MLRAKIIELLKEHNIPFAESGYEIEADLDRTGHKSYRIHPVKQAFFLHNKREGNIKKLYQRITKKTMPEEWVKLLQAQKKAEPEDKIKIQWARDRWANGKFIKQDQHFGILAKQYFSGRALDIDIISNQIKVCGVDSKQQKHNGAVTMVVMPMYRSWKDAVQAANGDQSVHVIGVQRLYLDVYGRKISDDARRMIGKQGITVIPPPQEPRKSAIVVVGEGIETVLSACQALKCGGIIAWNAGQMKVAVSAARKTGQGIILLVDRDRSETGQMTCSELYWDLIKSNYLVYYALPPDALQEHEKSVDWNDILKRYGEKGTEAALRIAMRNGSSQVRRPGSEIIVLSGVRAALAKGDEEEKNYHYEDIKTIRGNLDGLIEKVSQMRQTVMVKVPTGSGKTASIANQARESDKPILVLTQDHAQAEFFEEQGFFHYYGRTADEEAEPHCPGYNIIDKITTAHHSPAAEYCHRCPHGAVTVLNKLTSIDDNADFRTRKRRERAIQTLSNNGYSAQDTSIKPCGWLEHIDQAQQARLVVAPAMSYSHSLARWIDDHGESRDRIVIVDENAALSMSIGIGMEDIHVWAERAKEVVQEKTQAIAKRNDRLKTIRYQDTAALLKQENAQDEADIQRCQNAIVLFDALATELSTKLGENRPLTVDPKALSVLASLASDATAPWETLRFDRARLRVAPLKAASAIASTIAQNGGWVEGGKIYITAGVELFKRIRTHAGSTLILDATPDPVWVALSDEVINFAVRQDHVNITRYPGLAWGPGTAKSGDKNKINRELSLIWRAIKVYSKKEVAALVHKSVYDLLIKRYPEAKYWDIGYFGGDHRAHNRWAGKSVLLLFGGFYPPARTMQKIWDRARVTALAGGADPSDWPEWNGSMSTGHWIRETPDYEVQSRIALPDDPIVRDYFIRLATNETVQAIGRLRAVNRDGENLDVHIFGGLPLAGLEEHGLSVTQYARDIDGKARREEQVWARKQVAQQRLDAAVIDLASRGEKITRRSLAAAVKNGSGLAYSHGQPGTKNQGLRTATVAEYLRSSRPWLNEALDALVALSKHQASAALTVKLAETDATPQNILVTLRSFIPSVPRLAGQPTMADVERIIQSLDPPNTSTTDPATGCKRIE